MKKIIYRDNNNQHPPYTWVAYLLPMLVLLVLLISSCGLPHKTGGSRVNVSITQMSDRVDVKVNSSNTIIFRWEADYSYPGVCEKYRVFSVLNKMKTKMWIMVEDSDKDILFKEQVEK